MNFNHTDDRRMLADTLRRYLGDQYGIEERNKVAYAAPYHAPERWQEMAELGVMAALAKEADGGFGGTGFDIAVVFEELGRTLCPEPLLGQLMCITLLSELASDDDHKALLQALIAGEKRAALAVFEDDTSDNLDCIEASASASGDALKLNGTKRVVYGAPAADRLIVVAKHGDTLAVCICAADDAAIAPYAMIDGGGAAEVVLQDAPATLLAADARASVEAALDAGRLALCAEAVGALDVLVAMTAEYLTQRQQFGTVIAMFQALQHRIVDMANEVEQARSMTILAASKMDAEPAERSRYLAMAKNLIGRASVLVAEEATQLHGGIGMTWEYAGSHYTKRLVMLDHQLGDRYQQLERLLDVA